VGWDLIVNANERNCKTPKKDVKQTEIPKNFEKYPPVTKFDSDDLQHPCFKTC